MTYRSSSQHIIPTLRGAATLTFAALFFLPACGSRTSTMAPDFGGIVHHDGPIIHHDAPNPRVDAWIPQDGWIPLDHGWHDTWVEPNDMWPPPPWDTRPPPPDLRPPLLDNGLPCSSRIGTICASNGDCCGSLSCVSIYTGVQVCAPKCRPDDPNTKLVNEDSCSNLSSYRCVNVERPPMERFACLPRCTPVLGKNMCAQGIACNPASQHMSADLDSAFCAFPACTSDKDCPVRLATPCTVGTSNACTALGPGVFCAGDDAPDIGSPGHCARPGRCDTPSGLCAAHKQGNPAAQIGSLCKSDTDCGPAMHCLMEQQDPSGRTLFHNGYCSIEGCAFGNSLTERRCPQGATCSWLYAGGLCFTSCDPMDTKGCRNQSADNFGDYECYAWNNLAIGGGHPIAATPTCEPAIITCDFLGNAHLDCSVLGLQGNPSKMRCRDPQTGQNLPKTSPMGVCLDDTES